MSIWYILYSFGTLCIHVVHFVFIWYTLYSFGTFCIHLVHFVFVWYILYSFGTFFPVLVTCTKNNLATLFAMLSRVRIRGKKKQNNYSPAKTLFVKFTED
jgi:hypothetical protein